MTVTVADVGRKQFQAEEDDSVGNNIEISIGADNRVSIWIENPWAGDTESGFGRSCHIDISEEDARALAAWLLIAYAQDMDSSAA